MRKRYSQHRSEEKISEQVRYKGREYETEERQREEREKQRKKRQRRENSQGDSGLVTVPGKKLSRLELPSYLSRLSPKADAQNQALT